MDEKKLSKFLSLVLRHKPEELCIKLDSNGWTDVRELLKKLKSRGMDVNMAFLKQVVTNNDKQRFAFNENETEIRANQGHSTKEVELEFEKLVPPDTLYHGTSTDSLRYIHGCDEIRKMKRHHVHLSDNVDTAKKVGARHGSPTIIAIDAKAMHLDGFDFYKSENNVWLTDRVPAEYFKDTLYA